MITSRRRRNELAKVSKPAPVKPGREFSLKSGRQPFTPQSATGWAVGRLRRNPLMRTFLPR